METLGLTPSRKADSIWRNLLWPTIRSEVDVDQMGRQGFWLCVILAAFRLVFNLIAGVYIFSLGDIVFFVLDDIGARQRRGLAASVMFSVALLPVIVLLNH